MKIGGYTALKNQTIHRLIHKSTLFIIACSVMGGFIGFTSAKRDIADRPMAQLREAYRDIDKGYVSKGQPPIITVVTNSRCKVTAIAHSNLLRVCFRELSELLGRVFTKTLHT
jgi:hypothetical protein